jgi:hypothetical protein
MKARWYQVYCRAYITVSMVQTSNGGLKGIVSGVIHRLTRPGSMSLPHSEALLTLMLRPTHFPLLQTHIPPISLPISIACPYPPNPPLRKSLDPPDPANRAPPSLFPRASSNIPYLNMS